jgi:hypothetical protein
MPGDAWTGKTPAGEGPAEAAFFLDMGRRSLSWTCGVCHATGTWFHNVRDAKGKDRAGLERERAMQGHAKGTGHDLELQTYDARTEPAAVHLLIERIHNPIVRAIDQARIVGLGRTIRIADKDAPRCLERARELKDAEPDAAIALTLDDGAIVRWWYELPGFDYFHPDEGRTGR